MSKSDMFDIDQSLGSLPEIKAEEELNIDSKPCPLPGSDAFLSLTPLKREIATNYALTLKIDQLNLDKDALNIDVRKLSGLQSDKGFLLIICIGCTVLSSAAMFCIKNGNVCAGFAFQISAAVLPGLVTIYSFLKSLKSK
jgi:hypothetical protein